MEVLLLHRQVVAIATGGKHPDFEVNGVRDEN